MPKKAKKTLDLTLPIYQLKISLQRIMPRIWRRVQVDDCSLDELHEIIQASMGWDDEHLYAFVVEGKQYAYFEGADPYEYRDSRKVRLSDLVEQGCTRFRYDYDFGDDWQHLIDIEKTLPAEKGVRYPRCVKGERACPPEDCGGPYGYPYFLDKIEDPENEEHEETLEWFGDFDPEVFDLDVANGELRHLRCWLGRRRNKHSAEAAFAKGDLVKVKPGVVHDQYPDIPLGGWVGTVKRIAWLTPIAYGIRWSKPTLEQAHPIYAKRCRRDETKPSKCWLDEEQLEAAADKTPLAMEQPTNLISRPLSPEDPEDRIRVIFGLTSDDALPKPDEQVQRHFLDYLKSHLSFPFKAECSSDSVPDPDSSDEITVLGFADPALDRKDGLVCEARKGTHEFQVPLAVIYVSEDDPNFQHVADYTYWLWEVAEYYEEDEPEEGEPPQFPIGTVAYYGPDDKITTKIVAGVIQEEGAEPILKQWVATDVTTSPKVRKEIERFFKKHRVLQLAMSEGNMGCPHEEGKDFPRGGDCPFCPWWKGKQGSGAKE